MCSGNILQDTGSLGSGFPELFDLLLLCSKAVANGIDALLLCFYAAINGRKYL